MNTSAPLHYIQTGKAMTTYIAGSSIGDIPSFDRSQHVYFCCSVHPETEYFSKDPSVSRWFTTNDVVNTACGLSCPEMILTRDYVVEG